MNNEPSNNHVSIRNRQNTEALVILQNGDLTLLMLIKRSVRSLIVRNTSGVDEQYDRTVHEVGVLEVVTSAGGTQRPQVDQDAERLNCRIRSSDACCSGACRKAGTAPTGQGSGLACPAHRFTFERKTE